MAIQDPSVGVVLRAGSALSCGRLAFRWSATSARESLSEVSIGLENLNRFRRLTARLHFLRAVEPTEVRDVCGRLS